MTDTWKKALILNLPYLLFVYLFDKLCQAVRLAPGLDASEKFLHLSQGFTMPKGKTPANTAGASSTAAPDGARRQILPPMSIRSLTGTSL